MSKELIYNLPNVPNEIMPFVLREFLDHGINRFVFSSVQAPTCLKNPEQIAFLHGLEKNMGVRFLSMHAPYGPTFDLNIPDQERRPQMFRDHIRCMEIAKEFGSETYTIHVGAFHYIKHQQTLEESRMLAAETLDQLVPAAKKIGIVLAVENSFEPPNAAREVYSLVSRFGNEPAIGVCYDTGHANIMISKPGKDPAKYQPYMPTNWWETGVIPENDGFEKLKPYIVTTHMHDNDGYGDLHGMPFDGDIDWPDMIAKLRSCPRMLEFQTEVCYKDGTNWAGKLLAPVGGYSVKRIVETFRKLGF